MSAASSEREMAKLIINMEEISRKAQDNGIGEFRIFLSEVSILEIISHGTWAQKQISDTCNAVSLTKKNKGLQTKMRTIEVMN